MERAERNRYVRRAASRWLAVVAAAAAAAALTVDWLFNSSLATATFFFGVLASEFQLMRMGRTLQGGAALAYACARLPIAWTPEKLLLMPLTILSGATIYVGLLVIGATICFWTIKTPEVINAFTFGGEELTSYPLSIYNRWMRGVFLYLIPLGFANYPAALLLLGRSDPYGLPAWLAWLAPLVAGLFFSAALAFWRLGVSKYTSTGS